MILLAIHHKTAFIVLLSISVFFMLVCIFALFAGAMGVPFPTEWFRRR